MKNILLLASTSTSRKDLLIQAKIPFKIIGQNADEAACDWNVPLDKLVTSIAFSKMAHAVMPSGSYEGEVAYVLTADTLSQSADGMINGKPIDREDAKIKIRRARAGNKLCTAFCLEKKIWRNNCWITEAQAMRCVDASLIYNVPEDLLDYYLDHSLGLSASGAIAVEEFGLQFLESVTGSITAIIGLPLFEVRQELTNMGFFE